MRMMYRIYFPPEWDLFHCERAMEGFMAAYDFIEADNGGRIALVWGEWSK